MTDQDQVTPRRLSIEALTSPGVGAVVVRVHVLGRDADRDPFGVHDRSDAAQVHERRATTISVCSEGRFFKSTPIC